MLQVHFQAEFANKAESNLFLYRELYISILNREKDSLLKAQWVICFRVDSVIHRHVTASFHLYAYRVNKFLNTVRNKV